MRTNSSATTTTPTPRHRGFGTARRRSVTGAVAALGALTLAVGATSGTAAAASVDEIITAVHCSDGDGPATLEVSLVLTADNDMQQFTVTVDGDEFDDSPVGGGEHVLDSLVEDGIHQVEVSTGNNVLANPKVIVACDGPIIQAQGSCEDGVGNEKIDVGIWDQSDTWTYDVYIDGELALDNTEGLGHVAYFAIQVEPGTHLVEVDWLDDDTNDPVFSAEVLDGCNPDSGAGIPDAGSNTTPLLVLATVLVSAGFALIVIRRLRPA